MLEKKPKDSFARYGLAMEYAKQEEYAKAMEHFRKLWELHPDYSAAYFQGAQVLAKTGETERSPAGAHKRDRSRRPGRRSPYQGPKWRRHWRSCEGSIGCNFKVVTNGFSKRVRKPLILLAPFFISR